MDILEACRLLRFQSDWDRQFSHYNLLLDAGLSTEEAERISTLAAADRAEINQRIAA